MVHLYGMDGKPVAILKEKRLYNLDGRYVGFYYAKDKIFICKFGKYFGEIVDGKRLLYNLSSPHRFMSLGMQGNYGNIGKLTKSGNVGRYTASGYRDVEFYLTD